MVVKEVSGCATGPTGWEPVGPGSTAFQDVAKSFDVHMSLSCSFEVEFKGLEVAEMFLHLGSEGPVLPCFTGGKAVECRVRRMEPGEILHPAPVCLLVVGYGAFCVFLPGTLLDRLRTGDRFREETHPVAGYFLKGLSEAFHPFQGNRM